MPATARSTRPHTSTTLNSDNVPLDVSTSQGTSQTNGNVAARFRLNFTRNHLLFCLETGVVVLKTRGVEK